MINALKSDELIKKVGGPFRLTALVQRRLKELIEGARPLVSTEGKNLIQVAVEEIAENKIAIDYESIKDTQLPVTDRAQDTSERDHFQQ